MSDTRGYWLYAVSRPPAPEPLTGLAGVGGEPVHALEAAGLFAAASPVSLAEFGEAALRVNLEDLDWLAATARAHDAVVAAVARAGPAVPLRLASVHIDADGVHRMLRERREDFAAVLDRLSGRTEWGVKAYAEPAADMVTGEPHTAAGAGTAYLLRRKAQLSARESAARRATADAQQVHAALAELAAATRRHPAQDAQLAGTRAQMVLNGAYLVDDARSAAFRDRVAALQAERQAVRLQLTGPWPPYSFAAMPDENTGTTDDGS